MDNGAAQPPKISDLETAVAGDGGEARRTDHTPCPRALDEGPFREDRARDPAADRRGTSGLVAAHVTRELLTGTPPAGVHHIEQLPALASLPEALAPHGVVLRRLEGPLDR
jgi:hypothetical protein